VFTTTYDSLNRVLEKSVNERISNADTPLPLAKTEYQDASNQVEGLVGRLFRVTETDANRNRTVKLFDELGRLVQVTDPLGKISRSVYDGVNKRLDIDRRGYVTFYQYDATNRVTDVSEFADPQSVPPSVAAVAGWTPRSKVHTDYDDARLRVVETDRMGVKTIRENDALGRLRRLYRSHAELAEMYGATDVVLGDSVPDLVLESYEYDGVGNRTLFTDAADNRTMYVYDGANRQVWVIEGLGSDVEAITQVLTRIRWRPTRGTRRRISTTS
jgi:YD repeat-containing protein